MPTTTLGNESINTLATRTGVSKDVLRQLNPNLNALGLGGTINLPDTLTDIPASSVSDTTNLDQAKEQQKQDALAGFIEGQNTGDLEGGLVSSADTLNTQTATAIAAANAPVDATLASRSALKKRLDAENIKLGGKEIRETQLRDQAGIDASTQQLQNLNTEIAVLNAEFNKAAEALSSGTGLSTTIAGKQGQLRRQQAIEIGAKSAMSAALQGNIQLAEDLIDKKIELEFGAEERNIENTKFLLDLNYQDYTIAQKKQADDLTAILNERTRVLDEKKDIKKTIDGVMITVAGNNAPQDVINSIMESETLADALTFATPYLNPQMSAYEVEKQQLEIQKLRNEVSGVNAPLAGVERAEKVIDLRSTLRGEPAFKTVVEVKNGFQNLEVGASLDNAQGDLAIVNGYAKMLDPTGVVRPAEFDTVEEAQGFFERVLNYKDKIATGARLKSEVRQKFLDAGTELYNKKSDDLESNIRNIYEPISNAFGIDIDEIYSFKEVDYQGKFDELWNEDPTGVSQTINDIAEELGIDPENVSQEDILRTYGRVSFNGVGSDTNRATMVPNSIKIGAGWGVKNNNPGNLRLAGQVGATQGGGNFAKFNTPEEGWLALIGDIEAKKAPGGMLGPDNTLAEMIAVYAPAADSNDPVGYAQTVARNLGITPNTKIGQIDTYKLAKAIAMHESSTVIT